MAWTFNVVQGPPPNQLVDPPPNQDLVIVWFAPVMYTGAVLEVALDSHTNMGTLGVA